MWEEMQRVGVREDDTEDGEGQKKVIHCGNSYKKLSKDERERSNYVVLFVHVNLKPLHTQGSSNKQNKNRN